VLFAKPLRELDATTIHVFASNVVKTHGSVTDLKHFLPRILELLPRELCRIADVEIYLNTLRFSDWLKWPKNEVSAVRTFMFEWWRWTLSNYPADPAGLDALCPIAQAEDDLLTYLDEWDAQCRSTSSGLRQLVDSYHRDLIVHGHQDQLSLGPFWNDRKEQESQVCRWLVNDTNRTHIKRARREYASHWGMENELELILQHHGIWRRLLSTPNE